MASAKVLGAMLKDITASLEAYSQIALVANEHDGHVWIGMLPCIFQPGGEMVESFPPAETRVLVMLHAYTISMQKSLNLPGDVIHKQCTSSTSIIRSSDRPE